MPSKSSKSWESGAKMVKNTQVTNQYLEHIRDVHDPSMHIKTIEDELKSTMGKALGKQGDKILRELRLMKEQKDIYDSLLESILPKTTLTEQEKSSSTLGNNDTYTTHSNEENFDITPIVNSIQAREICEVVDKYNMHRKACVHARWELIVHRQAIGFIVNNHKFVHDKFPIPDALILPEVVAKVCDDSESINSGNANADSNTRDATTKQFGDQLSWWEKVGRWR